MRVVLVTLTETAKTPGGRAGKRFCDPFYVLIEPEPQPRRALGWPIRTYPDERH